MQNDYLNRINKVIDYMQNNIEEELSLHHLAKIATFSPFHFHRIFKAIVGESINDYVQRMRLERAAKRLITNFSSPITDIAMDVGFSSASVFARAFKAYFGISASQFRRDYSNNCKVKSKISKEGYSKMSYDLLMDSADPRINTTQMRSVSFMNVEIRQLPTYHVAYVRNLEGYDKGVYNKKITEAFDKTAAWVGANQLFTEHTVCMGVFYDFQEITPSEKRRYDAAFVVPNHVTEGTGEVNIQDIQGGQYAICRIEVENENEHAFEYAIAEMNRGFEYIYGVWLPNSMYELEDKPCLEFYLTPRNVAKIVIEACVPVKPM